MSRKQTKEEEYLKRKRFHSKSSWPGRSKVEQVMTTGSGSSQPLPPGIGANLRYSRITQRLTTRPPVPVDENEWEDVYEDNIEKHEGDRRPGTRGSSRVIHKVVKPQMRSVFVNAEPSTRTAQVQTGPMVSDMAALREDQKQAREVRKLVQTLEPLTGTVQQQVASLEETRRSLKRLTVAHRELMDRVAEGGADTKAVAVDSARREELIQSIKHITQKIDHLTSEQEQHRTESSEEVKGSITEVIGALKSKVVPVESFIQFANETKQQLKLVTDELLTLKRRHDKLNRAMDKSNTTQQKLLEQEESLKHVATMLEDIHGYTMEKKAEDEEESKKNVALAEPNDSRGKMFMHNNALPTDDPAIISLVAKLLACIEADEEKQLTQNLETFKIEALQSWGSMEDIKKAINSLFKTALFLKSNKSSLVLADAVTASDLKSKGSTPSKSSMAEKIKNAINFQNKDMGRQLLDRMGDQQRKQVVNTEIKGEYGMEDSYLLFVSSRSGDLDMFTYLITCGADLRMTEGKKQQTVLHLLSELSMDSTKEKVVINMLDVIYKQAGVWWDQKDSTEAKDQNHKSTEVSRLAGLHALFEMTNGNGFKPLQLAASQGSPKLIHKMLNNEPFHTITDPVHFDCDSRKKVYFMDQIDIRFSIGGQSVLETIVDRKDHALEIVEMEPFHQIFSDKWDRYRVFYWIWFIMYLLYMCTYSACAVGRHLNSKTLAESYSSTGDKVRACAEIFCLLTLPLFFYGAYCDLLRRRSAKASWFFTDGVRMGNFIFVFCVIMTMVFRLLHDDLEDIFLCVSLILGWMLTTRFLVATPLMGVFPSVIFKVFKDDILKRFIWIFLILLVGNTTAMFCAYQRDNIEQIPSESFWFSMFSVFKLTFGMLETGYETGGRYPAIGITLFILYLWLGNILLVNMLIAMVNDTYSSTKHEQEKAWQHTRAWYGLLMESRLPQAVWIPYDNKRHNVRPSKSWRLLDKVKFYTQTRLKYGHKLRPRKSLQDPEIRQHFVIVN